MPSTASVTDFRESVESIGEAAARDVAAVWDSWSWDDPFSVRGAASLVVPDVVWTYGDVAAGFAADQYDEWRESERVPGRFVASPAALAVEDQILAGIRYAVGSLFGPEPDVAAAQTLLAGSLTRHVIHGATDTVVEATRSDPQAVGWSRHARGSACKFCRMLAGRESGVYRSERTARFASHGHCIPGDTLVQAPGVEAATRRRYQGEVVVIRTARGGELPITPNHPVLTRRGWVRAGLLRVGDQVFHGGITEGNLLRVPYEQHVPTSAEDIWGACSVARLRRMPVSAEDFHGDIGRGNSYVDVVPADRLLSPVCDPDGVESFAQAARRSALRPAGLDALATGRRVPDLMVRPSASPCRRMRGIGPSDTLLRRARSDPESLGFAYGTCGDASFRQPPRDGRPGHAVRLGHAEDAFASVVSSAEVVRHGDGVQRLVRAGGRRFNPTELEGDADGFAAGASQLASDLGERLTGVAQLDRVVDLGRREFAGHVFNFQTVEGWYSANGLVVSNCSCVAAPSWDPDAPDMPTVAYVAQQGEKSDADRARVREFLASMA